MSKQIILFAVVLVLSLCSIGQGADFDGLIIDSGDNYFIPALVNRIFSESGDSIYDPLKISQKVLAEQGCGEYTDSVEKAKTVLEQKRGVKNPLIVKAIGLLSSPDIIVSNSDAKKILSAAKKRDFLSRARVAFVLSAKGTGAGRKEGVVIEENFIKIIIEGLANPAIKADEKERSAIVSAMILSLRRFAETLSDLRKLVADYNAAKKKGDEKFIEDNKELYEKARLYKSAFKKFNGKSSIEGIEDFNLYKSYLNYNFGPFMLKSRTLLRDAHLEYDLATLIFKDGKQITVRDGELLEPLDMKHHFALLSMLKKLGFENDFEYDRKEGVAVLALKYNRR